jgi:hypothetical protein
MKGSRRTPRSRAGPSIKPTETLSSSKSCTISLGLPLYSENRTQRRDRWCPFVLRVYDFW